MTRKIINGFIVFALCGLWHGAAWNFILWGVSTGCLAICGNYRLLLGRFGANAAWSLIVALRFPGRSRPAMSGSAGCSSFIPCLRLGKWPAPFSPGEVSVPYRGLCGSGGRLCHLLRAGPVDDAKEYLQDFARPAPVSRAGNIVLPDGLATRPWLADNARRPRTRPLSSSAATPFSTVPGRSGMNSVARLAVGIWADRYHVVNFSAPGAGGGGQRRRYLRMPGPGISDRHFVTNTEPGYYPAANRSAYAYLFWDAYCKGLLSHDARRPPAWNGKKATRTIRFQVEPAS